jgi:5'-methylthioadenosine phosphorylase
MAKVQRIQGGVQMADRAQIGVIGGSGLYQMQGLEDVHEVRVSTPFGEPSDALVLGKIEGVAAAFLPRHGRGHVHTPTEVPYRANIYALKALGVESILSISACGSLQERLRPGDIIVPDQLFDFTKLRKSSFFGDGLVAHVSVADPFCSRTSRMLSDTIEELGATIHVGGTYITIEGPRFSTKGESRVYRSWGMDIIGMTASPEAFLAREAGICYATMAHVTDYDVWHASEETVTVEMVVRQLNENVALAQDTIRRLAPKLAAAPRDCDCSEALATALITAPDHIRSEIRSKLALLTDPYLLS